MKDSCEKGKIIDEWYTGDPECNAYSEEYECGAIYNHNYMDIIGNRDHDCFWDCRNYKKGCSEEIKDTQDEEVIIFQGSLSRINPVPKNFIVDALNCWDVKLKEIENKITSLSIKKMSKQDILDEVVHIIDSYKFES